MPFIPGDDPFVALHPGIASLNLPPAFVTPQLPAVLYLGLTRHLRCRGTSSVPKRSLTCLSCESKSQALSPTTSFRAALVSLRQACFNRGHLVPASRHHTDGDRKRVVAANDHDFRALALFREANTKTPFLRATAVLANQNRNEEVLF